MSFATQENMPPIGEGLFNAILLVIPPGSTILELGSGDGSTTELKKAGYTVYSIEHNQNYVGRWNDVEHTIYARLLDNTKFYDLEGVKFPSYDLLLVDGPDTEERNQSLHEYALHRFDPKVPWFFDDWAGDQMSMGIKAIAQTTGRTLLTFADRVKQYAVLLPEGRC